MDVEAGTIYIDDRVGSADLADYLPAEQVSVTRLECADAMFIGHGPEGKRLSVGVEVKTIGDLISSIDSGRFVAGQLPCLSETYDVNYLVVEGTWRVDPATDRLQVLQRGGWMDYSFGQQVWLGRGLESWLISMEMLAGLRIRHSRNRQDTARLIAAIHRWFMKEWDQHTALQAIHRSQIKKGSLLRMFASILPGIGWKRSGAVEDHFTTIRAMVNAPVDEWMKIEGIGRGIAEKVARSLD